MIDSLLANRLWAIEQRYWHSIKPIVLGMISSGQFDEKLVSMRKEQRPVMTLIAIDSYHDDTPDPEPIALNFNQSTSNGNLVAVIPLQGVMQKNGDWCSYGTKDVISWIEQANADPKVSGIVLHTDSPGGSVDGTPDLGRAVKQSAKPVIAFVDGMAASAAYWVASQAREVIMNDEHASWVGSIGTLIMHIDYSKFLEMEGLKVTFITADKSTDKVKGNWAESLDESAIGMFKADLNMLNDQFIKTVKAGRKDRLKTEDEDIYTGKMYHGAKAVALGMADKVGTLKDAIYRADLLARKDKEQQSKQATHLILDL